MQVSSRTVYQRQFTVTPVWLWVVQRLSGLLLGPLVLVHMWTPRSAVTPYVDTLLLLLVVVHGSSGLRRMARKGAASGGAAFTSWTWSVIVVVFGIVLLSSYHW